MNTRAFIGRLVSLAVTLVIFLLAVAAIHEGYHYLAAKSLGYPVSIDLTWLGKGSVAWDGAVPGQPQRAIIFAAGGLGTAVFSGGLWWAAAKQVQFTTVLGFITLQQVFYVPLDVLGWWQNQWLVLGTFLVAGVVTALIYGRELIVWLAGEAKCDVVH